MDTNEYIQSRYAFLLQKAKELQSQWQKDDCYLLNINPYSPENWARIYELFRNDKQFRIDMSILFSGEILSKALIKHKEFSMGKVVIEEFDNQSGLYYYSLLSDNYSLYSDSSYLRIIYSEADHHLNGLEARQDVLDICCSIYQIEKYVPDISEYNFAEIDTNKRSKLTRAIFHYYAIQKLSKLLPVPKDLIEAELKTYFEHNLIGNHKIEEFKLEGVDWCLQITPVRPDFKDYKAENYDVFEALNKIGRKYNTHLSFNICIYSTST